MARITKVEGTVRVFTESGGSFTLTVVGHGMRSDGSITDLGPYVGRLVSDELRKVLLDEPKPEPTKPPAASPVVRKPVSAPPSKAPKGVSRG